MNATIAATCLLVTCLWASAGAAEPTPSFAWNPTAAAAYLDERETWWMDSQTAARDHETFCISCHTAVPYALARPALRTALGEREASPNEQRLLAIISKRVRLWNEVEPFYSDDKKGQVKAGDARPGDVKAQESRGTEAILNALILARNDAPRRKLSADTRT